MYIKMYILLHYKYIHGDYINITIIIRIPEKRWVVNFSKKKVRHQ